MLGGPISGKLSMARSCQNSCHCSFSMQVPPQLSHRWNLPMLVMQDGATELLCSTMFYIHQSKDLQFISACGSSANCPMPEILQQFQEKGLSSSYLTGPSFTLFVALPRNIILWSGFLVYAAPAVLHVPVYFFFLLANISQVGKRWKSSECIVYLPTHALSKASPRLQAQN